MTDDYDWQLSGLKAEFKEAMWKIEDVKRSAKNREHTKRDLEILNRLIPILIEKAQGAHAIVKTRLEVYADISPEVRASAAREVEEEVEEIAKAAAEKDALTNALVGMEPTRAYTELARTVAEMAKVKGCAPTTRTEGGHGWKEIKIDAPKIDAHLPSHRMGGDWIEGGAKELCSPK
jgi:hypothetical protein